MDSRSAQIAFAATALGPAVLAIGFITQSGWAESTWPFETSRLSDLFLGAILAAIAVPVIWVSARREWAALGASAMFPFVMFGAMAIYLVAEQLGDESGLAKYAIGMAVAAAYGLALIVAGSRLALIDRRPLPLLVRASFAVFGVVLIAAGLALALGADNVMPWPVVEQSGVMFGFIFLGASTSYVYGALRPVWGYAIAPLLGFLAYDVVLLPPLVDHFSDVLPEQRTSLILYFAVLVYSAALAIYYLLIHPGTRLWDTPGA